MNTRIVATALLLLCGAPAAWAQQEQPFVPTDQAARPWEAGHTVPDVGMGEYTGTIALTGKRRMLLVQKRATTQVYVVNRTKILDGAGKPLPQTALHDGEQVKLDFDVRGNTNIARRVTILAPPEPLPAAPPVAAPAPAR